MDSENAPIPDRYRPVVAIEVESLLAVDLDPPFEFASMKYPRGATTSSDAAADEASVSDEYDPGFDGRWVWLSDEGRSWVLSLFDRGIKVVWWSQWNDSADGYFGHAPGLSDMPSARHPTPSDDDATEEFAKSPLQVRAKGRPLVLVTNVPTRMAEEEYIRMRRPVDRPITALRAITDPDRRTLDTMAEMDAWLALVRTAPGQEALRRHRRRRLARPRRGEARTDQLGERLPPASEVAALATRYENVDAWVKKLVGGVREVLQERGYDLADVGSVNEIVELFRAAIKQADRARTANSNKEPDE